MTDPSQKTGPPLQPFGLGVLIVVAIIVLSTFVAIPFTLPFLNAREVTLDLEPGVRTFTAALPPTEGSIELELSPNDRLEVTSPSTRREADMWIVDDCASGCRLVVERVDQDSAAEPATLRISYSLNDSEYVDDIVLEPAG